MAEITTNSYDVARARAEYLMQFGAGLDAKRPSAWTEYGYKTQLDFDDFRQAYERGGAGHGAVQKLLARCWSEWPRIKKPEADDETPWEKQVAALITGIKGWQKFQGFDRRNLIGRYAALIYRVADGKALREPLVKATKLVDIVPLFEDQIKVTEWFSDTNDTENYGKPRMFQYRTRSPSSVGDREAKPQDWVDVHPSRVQILAEGSDSDDFYEGVPLLKAGFNSLVDIEKLSGGGAESALKNSARTIKFEYDAAAAPQAITSNPDGTPGTKTVREVHEEQTRKLNRSQDSAIVIQGGKADTLQTQVANLGPQFEIAANLFSASVGIPFTILFGQQTGRLASDEDQKEMNARAAARQRNELTPMLTEFVRRMQDCNVIEAGEFEIEWPDLGAPTDEQKIDKAAKMAVMNKTTFDGGGTTPIFDENEIRKAAGYEERDEGQGDGFKEETPPAEPLADPLAKPGTKPATPPKADPAAK
ncbi:phage portal protein [Roseateles sp.]|uniref:anti-CBASS protein Acb1 family protein n=1 Tax=Roseateles sp. TaxID=1971397 RepID=UPI0031DD1F6D